MNTPVSSQQPDNKAVSFSIVMPAFNASAHISRAINSVLRQSYPNFELVIIDDGSTDSTLTIIGQFSDPRIRVISQDNAGVSAARNTGIELSRYPWIAFLDSDDEWSPHFLKSTAIAINTYPDVVATFANYELKSLGAESQHDPESKLRIQEIDDYLEYISHRHYRGAHTSTTVVARSALDRAGLFRQGVRYGEDKDLWMRLSWVGAFAHIEETLGSYHQDNPDSAMSLRLVNDIEPPPTLQSFDDWRRADTIPQEKYASAEKYVARENLTYATWLLQVGEAKRARQVVKEYSSIVHFSGVARILTVVSYVVPPFIIRFVATGVRKTLLPFIQSIRSR